MVTAAIQSRRQRSGPAPPSGTSDGEHQLRQVAREVAVQRVDAARAPAWPALPRARRPASPGRARTACASSWRAQLPTSPPPRRRCGRDSVSPGERVPARSTTAASTRACRAATPSVGAAHERGRDTPCASSSPAPGRASPGRSAMPRHGRADRCDLPRRPAGSSRGSTRRVTDGRAHGVDAAVLRDVRARPIRLAEHPVRPAPGRARTNGARTTATHGHHASACTASTPHSSTVRSYAGSMVDGITSGYSADEQRGDQRARS